MPLPLQQTINSCAGASGAVPECCHCGNPAEERGTGGMEAVRRQCQRTSSEVCIVY